MKTRTILSLTALLFFTGFLSAQDLLVNPEYISSDTDEKVLDLYDAYGKVIGETENGIYVLSHKREGVAMTDVYHSATISLVDPNTAKLIRTEELSFYDKKFHLVELMLMNNQGKLIAYTTLDQGKTLTYCSWKFNEQNFSFEEQKTLFESKMMSDRGWRPRSGLILSKSEDGSKLLLHDRQMTKNGAIEYFLIGMNDNLQIDWIKEGTFQKPASKDFVIEAPWLQVEISNQGDVALFTRSNKGAQNTFFLQFEGKEQTTNSKPMRILDKDLARSMNVAHIQYTPENQIRLTGAYSYKSKDEDGLEGWYVFNIDPKTKTVTDKKLTPFTKDEKFDILISHDTRNLVKDKFNKKIVRDEEERKEELEKDGELDWKPYYSTLASFQHNDGSYSLVIEEFDKNRTEQGEMFDLSLGGLALEDISDNNPWRQTLPNQATLKQLYRELPFSYRSQIRLFGDIVILNFSASGDLNWIRNIHRPDLYAMPSAAFLMNDKIALLYPYDFDVLKISMINSKGKWGQKILLNEEFEDEKDFDKFSSDIGGILTSNRYLGFMIEAEAKPEGVPFILKF